jgi:hypothetical protein
LLLLDVTYAAFQCLSIFILAQMSSSATTFSHTTTKINLYGSKRPASEIFSCHFFFFICINYIIVSTRMACRIKCILSKILFVIYFGIYKTSPTPPHQHLKKQLARQDQSSFCAKIKIDSFYILYGLYSLMEQLLIV